MRCEQVTDLAKDYLWVQVFENKGAAMGCSNPHPHGQIWANNFLPNELAREEQTQKQWLAEKGSPLLLQYAQKEQASGERTVVETETGSLSCLIGLPGLLKRYCCQKRMYFVSPGEWCAKTRSGAGVWNYSPAVMTTCSSVLSLIPWDGMVRLIRKAIWNIGNCMPGFIRRYYVQRRCANLWWVMKCWRNPAWFDSRTSRRTSACCQRYSLQRTSLRKTAMSLKEKVLAVFQTSFGCEPDLFVRAPGRHQSDWWAYWL